MRFYSARSSRTEYYFFQDTFTYYGVFLQILKQKNTRSGEWISRKGLVK